MTSTITIDVQTAISGVNSLRACVQSRGEPRLVGPSLDKVAVKSHSAGITIGIDELVRVLDGSGVVEELVEDRPDSFGMVRRADTKVVVVCGIRHLVLQICVSMLVNETLGHGPICEFYLTWLL